MTTSVVGAPAMAPHATRRVVVRMAAGVALLAAASAGMYEGAQAVTRHYNSPTSNVSYASPDAIARTLSGAVHTPAKQGAFLDGADIASGNVVSVVVAVAP